MEIHWLLTRSGSSTAFRSTAFGHHTRSSCTLWRGIVSITTARTSKYPLPQRIPEHHALERQGGFRAGTRRAFARALGGIICADGPRDYFADNNSGAVPIPEANAPDF